jgi:hypothetical protein
MDHFQDGDIAPLKDIWLAVEPYPSEKYDFVSWEVINFMFQTTNQL